MYTSSEEKALLKAAEAFGFFLVDSSERRKVVKIKDLINKTTHEYKILGYHNNELTQTEGVLVQKFDDKQGPNGSVILYTKGPFDSMCEFLEDDQLEDQ